MSTKAKTYVGLAVLWISIVAGCASSSSLYPIKIGGRYGYINKSGKLSIPAQFDDVGKFSEGVAPVKIGNVWGYIDSKGKFVINPQFDVADPFSNGLALVGSNYRYGYIDKDG